MMGIKREEGRVYGECVVFVVLCPLVIVIMCLRVHSVGLGLLQ